MAHTAMPFFHGWVYRKREKEGAMKLRHLSDVHLGKRVGEVSLLADQRDILQKILELAQT